MGALLWWLPSWLGGCSLFFTRYRAKNVFSRRTLVKLMSNTRKESRAGLEWAEEGCNHANTAGSGSFKLYLYTTSMVPNRSESTVVQSNEVMMHEGMDDPILCGSFENKSPKPSDLIVNVISDWGP